ncbi:hypothetical protein [Paenibacillus sp. L3-i20]|uniref:hypothetical protein n=1 Tax=Paenibacillus sp. L3-i20 TaxID=2905833 RepID=UPI001EE136A2|nr:hypothetical protein [Paenibacillus sp. L3-i20]GKU77186.1 hypothetical protein L3i20_v215830 [Paenibacillus sp. L3-i20]
MIRRLAWLGKLIAAGLILSFLSIWTTGYIVTSYVDTLLKQYELPIEVPPMAMSGVWGKLWGANPPVETKLSSPQVDSTIDNSESESTTGTKEPDSVEAFGEIEQAPITDIGIGEGSHAAGESEAEPGREVQEGTSGVDGTETAVTTDEIESTKQMMSEEDKTQLFQLLMTKLPQESWQQISEFVENGLTETELTSVEQIMAQHLDTAEYERMLEILKKY